jgi:hypothetical protein
MNERTKAILFSADLDRLPIEKGTLINASHELTPTSSDLQIALLLSELDFSARSSCLFDLQTRIIERCSVIGQEIRGESQLPIAQKIVMTLRQPLPITIITLCVMLVLIQCLVPGGIPSAGEAVADYITSTLRLGSLTVVETFDATKMPSSPPSTPPITTEWVVPTPMGSIVDIVPEGAPLDGWHFSTLIEVHAIAKDFSFLAPAFIPEGYRLDEALLSPSKFWLVVRYSGISGTPITYVAHNGNGFTIGIDGDDKDVLQIDLNGISAAWLDGRILVWEQGAVSYAIAGGVDSMDQGLSMDQAVKIAESFR